MDNYTEVRPWGKFTVLYDGPECKVKILEVNPGQRLSYQYHHKREENWVVVSGKATVVLDDLEQILGCGEHIFIPKGAKHRICNQSDDLVRIAEVQTGEYFGEDDIVRIEDDYKRE